MSIWTQIDNKYLFVTQMKILFQFGTYYTNICCPFVPNGQKISILMLNHYLKISFPFVALVLLTIPKLNCCKCSNYFVVKLDGI